MGCSSEPKTSDFRAKLNEGKNLKSIDNSEKSEIDENKKKNIENSVNNSKNRENKENSEIENEDDDKENEEKMKNNLENLFKSYYIAKTYFCENEFKEKEVDAIRKCKKIIEAKELLEQGLFKKIKEKELPKEITPEYITGYTEEKLQEAIDKKQINFIITSIMKNQWFSKTSPFYRQYKKPNLKKVPMEQYKEENDEE
jgi:hypothetical protein